MTILEIRNSQRPESFRKRSKGGRQAEGRDAPAFGLVTGESLPPFQGKEGKAGPSMEDVTLYVRKSIKATGNELWGLHPPHPDATRATKSGLEFTFQGLELLYGAPWSLPGDCKTLKEHMTEIYQAWCRDHHFGRGVDAIPEAFFSLVELATTATYTLNAINSVCFLAWSDIWCHVRGDKTPSWIEKLNEQVSLADDGFDVVCALLYSLRVAGSIYKLYKADRLISVLPEGIETAEDFEEFAEVCEVNPSSLWKELGGECCKNEAIRAFAKLGKQKNISPAEVEAMFAKIEKDPAFNQYCVQKYARLFDLDRASLDLDNMTLPQLIGLNILHQKALAKKRKKLGEVSSTCAATVDKMRNMGIPERLREGGEVQKKAVAECRKFRNQVKKDETNYYYKTALSIIFNIGAVVLTLGPLGVLGTFTNFAMILLLATASSILAGKALFKEKGEKLSFDDKRGLVVALLIAACTISSACVPFTSLFTTIGFSLFSFYRVYGKLKEALGSGEVRPDDKSYLKWATALFAASLGLTMGFGFGFGANIVEILEASPVIFVGFLLHGYALLRLRSKERKWKESHPDVEAFQNMLITQLPSNAEDTEVSTRINQLYKTLPREKRKEVRGFLEVRAFTTLRNLERDVQEESFGLGLFLDLLGAQRQDYQAKNELVFFEKGMKKELKIRWQLFKRAREETTRERYKKEALAMQLLYDRMYALNHLIQENKGKGAESKEVEEQKIKVRWAFETLKENHPQVYGALCHQIRYVFKREESTRELQAAFNIATEDPETEEDADSGTLSPEQTREKTRRLMLTDISELRGLQYKAEALLAQPLEEGKEEERQRQIDSLMGRRSALTGRIRGYTAQLTPPSRRAAPRQVLVGKPHHPVPVPPSIPLDPKHSPYQGRRWANSNGAL